VSGTPKTNNTTARRTVLKTKEQNESSKVLLIFSARDEKSHKENFHANLFT